MTLTVIGDSHGKFDKYYEIASKSQYSVSVGDLGLSETWNKLHYSDLSPSKHVVVCGNHEDYNIALKSPFSCGNFGNYILGSYEFFFIRGGISIDRVYRVGEELNGSKKTWWSEEELSFTQMLECIKVYKKTKPKMVLSHVPPACFIDNIHGNKGHSILQKFKFHEGFIENTALLCDELFKIHQPDIWLSGHHHRSYTEQRGRTQFISLAELESVELI